MAFEKGKGTITAGEDKVRFFAKEIESISTTVEFAETDLIGELTDCTGMGSKRDTKGQTGYHYDTTLKVIGNKNDNDVSFTENLTTDELATINTRYDGKKLCAYGAFDKESKKLLYGFAGTIIEKGVEIPNGELCQLTYTVSGEEKTGYTMASV